MAHACWDMDTAEYEKLEAWIEANYDWLDTGWHEQNALGDSRGYEEITYDEEAWIEYCADFYLTR